MYTGEIISAAAVIIVALIEWRASQDRKLLKQAQEEEKLRAIQREKENRLSMQMLDATMQLSIVTANALTGGHNNGNVEAAKKAAEDASRAYKAFLMDTAAHNIS